MAATEAYTSNLATLSRYLERELSTHALDETARYLRLGIAMVINALNPAQVLVGGEITKANDRLEPIIRGVIIERALTASSAATPILVELPGISPRLRGATALVAAPLYAAPQVA